MNDGRTASLAHVSLEDKYRVAHGHIFLSGLQALVRLLMLQREKDRACGLNTAGFVSGYRGSPLGGFDLELMKARAVLAEHDVVFRPGLNEDLAATAIWGTQQVDFIPGRKVDGVFALWYGKGPGVDRSGDAFKHANRAGTARYGGVLLAFGDDHAGKSSSLAHQSDLSLAALEIPVLYPASIAEIIEYGLAGFAMSRYSGLLVGMKLVNETAEAKSTIEVEQGSAAFEEPVSSDPPDGVNIRKELAIQGQDRRIIACKLPRACVFARKNGLDAVTFGAQQPRLVIVTSGKAYGDVMRALSILELDEATAQEVGLAVYKVAMIYPLDPVGLKSVCSSAEEILVVEEKRPHVEAQIAAILFNEKHRPRLSGKMDPVGRTLLPADVTLDPSTVARAIAARLCEDQVTWRNPAMRSAIRAVMDGTPGYGAGDG